MSTLSYLGLNLKKLKLKKLLTTDVETIANIEIYITFV